MQVQANSAEDLVLFGFRNLMAAHEFSDVSCWERVWESFIAKLGEDRARRLVGELQYWGRVIRQRAGDRLQFFPASCGRMCDFEAVALATVSAAQCDNAEAGKMAARLLLGTEDREAIEAVWRASICLGCSLKEGDQVMCPVAESMLNAIAQRQKAKGASN